MQCVPEVPFSEPGPELHGHCPVPGGSTSEYQGCMQSLCILIFTTNTFIKGKKDVHGILFGNTLKILLI